MNNRLLAILFLSLYIFIPLVISMELPPDGKKCWVSEYSKELRLQGRKRLKEVVEKNSFASSADDEVVFSPSCPSDLLESDVKAYVKGLYDLSLSEFYQIVEKDYGITAEMVQKHYPEATRLCLADPENEHHYGRANVTIEQAAARVQKKLRCSPLKIQRIKKGTSTFDAYRNNIAGINVRGAIVCREDEMKKVAPSPASRDSILMHEKMHQKNNDQIHLTALRLAFKEKNIPLPGRVRNHLSRIQETFAELFPCSFSAQAAQASARVSQRIKHEIGAHAPTHPSADEQVELALLVSDIHEEDQKEAARQEQREIEERRIRLAQKTREMFARIEALSSGCASPGS